MASCRVFLGPGRHDPQGSWWRRPLEVAGDLPRRQHPLVASLAIQQQHGRGVRMDGRHIRVAYVCRQNPLPVSTRVDILTGRQILRQEAIRGLVETRLKVKN